jgi:hypothetical protein
MNNENPKQNDLAKAELIILYLKILIYEFVFYLIINNSTYNASS